jgi:uncharacterized protein YbbC (DUF1343 family)
MPIDILAGSAQLRQQIEAGESAAAIARGWSDDEAAFRRLREKHLLY